MTTDVMTLSQYAELVQDLADTMSEEEDEEPIVLIGDTVGDVQVSAQDGRTKRGTVAYSQDVFDENGVMELGQKVDTRLFGTALFRPSDLDESTIEDLRQREQGSEA